MPRVLVLARALLALHVMHVGAEHEGALLVLAPRGNVRRLHKPAPNV